MKKNNHAGIRILTMILIILKATPVSSQGVESMTDDRSVWHLSFQYLGLTWHPGGGGNAEVYPLKFEKKGYLVPEIGAAINLDYRLSHSFFFRITSAMYKDCAFLSAACIHAGPRFQLSWGDNSVNAGMGPILSFRQDWHRFEEYQDDEFYGDRIAHGWQYRLFPFALELEYLHRISDSKELQWSVIPGVPLVITFMFGIRFSLGEA